MNGAESHQRPALKGNTHRRSRVQILSLIEARLHDQQTWQAARVLNACPQLADGPQGKALKLAIDLIDQNPRAARRHAQTLAATTQAREIAAHFELIADVFARLLNPDDVAAIGAILNGG